MTPRGGVVQGVLPGHEDVFARDTSLPITTGHRPDLEGEFRLRRVPTLGLLESRGSVDDPSGSASQVRLSCRAVQGDASLTNDY